jgi:cytochrome c556
LGGSAGVANADSHGADSEASGEIKYRQSLMEGVGSNMAAIGDILKNQLDLPGHVQNHASQLALAADLVAAAFKNGSAEGPTDAKAKIWTDWKGFEAAIADFDTAARNLESAAASGDPAAVGPAVKALGKSCGGCHKPYRNSKEESYKNK